MALLHYGTGSSVEIESANGTALAVLGEPQGQPLADLGAAVAAALEQPLEYPPLRQSTTVGDRIVLALGQGVPRAAEITAAAVHTLVAAGVDPDGISILRTEADVDCGAGDPREMLEGELFARVRLATHDPANRGGLAYLAANDEGDPILLNRLLTDADLVLPIARLWDETSPGCFGIHQMIFPALSDGQAQLRFRREALGDNAKQRRPALVGQVEQAAWLLGINFTIQVVPAAGGGVLQVLSGSSEAVARRSRELYRAAWACSAPPRASLVVAALPGPPQQQTWENFGRALASAGRLVDEGGIIAVCCDLAAAPGPGVQRLIGARDRKTAMRHICHDGPVDGLVARQLARAVERGHVYLLSRLSPALVEDLDMVPIGGAEELGRLAGRQASCIVLANAAEAVVRPGGKST